MTPDASLLRAAPLGLAAAVAFLTRVPVGRAVAVDAKAVGAAAPFYPLVGAGLGALAGLAERGLSPLLPPLVVAVLLVALLALLTGALHLDALADTVDALGGQSRQESLRIMRDHAVGAFGATTITLALVLKVAAVGALIESGHVIAGLVAAGACSRASVLPLAVALPDARRGGRSSSVSEQVSGGGAVLGLVVAAALAVLVAGVAGVFVLVAALALAVSAGVFYWRWLGGVTGDALGAVIELSELAALSTALVAL